MPDLWLTLIVLLTVCVLLGLFLLVSKQYKKCPSNRVLVIFGSGMKGKSALTLHGGGKFVWPIIQDFTFLSLDPMQIEVPLKGALSMENIRVNVPSVFTVAVGTDPATMNNAAERLLGLTTEEIMKQSEDIIFGQLRQVIASMKIEDINRDRDKFLESIQDSIEPELNKIGLVLINVNITDITDESGYIEAIGRKAASEAVQQAEIDVAEQQKKGAIGVAEAEREKKVTVANAEKLQDIGMKDAERERAVRLAELEKERTIGEQAAAFEQEAKVKDDERMMRIAVAEADAKAVAGENLSKAEIARVNADLRVTEAEAYQVAETKQREADAAVREAQYLAEAKAAQAMAQKIEEEKRAEWVASANAAKSKQIVDAEAVAEQKRIDALAEADAIYAKLEAQARGEYEILAKKGEGLERIVEACGGSQQAFQMLTLEHIDHLSETAASAIRNIKFDKVVVWDGGPNGNGQGATSNFLRGLAHSLPPMMNLMKDVGGIEMPEYFGRVLGEEDKEAEEKELPVLTKAEGANKSKKTPPKKS